MRKIILFTVCLEGFMYREVRVLLVSLSFLLVGALTASAQGYPTPTPNFAHPATPHPALYVPVTGFVSRPLLVIYRQFTDVSPDPANDSAWAAQRFFGLEFPSLRGYYLFNSFGNVVFEPAQETQGTVNDGIVVVNTNITADDFWAMSTGDQRKTGLEGADPFVNFADFDKNVDGKVTNEELIVVQMHVARNPGENCGQTDWNSPVTLDGKQIELFVAQGTEITNLISHIHEVGHAALNIMDFYGYGVGSLDASGPTCGSSDDTFFNFSSYQKMHFGWIQPPTVVTEDGFYEIRDTAVWGEPFILYDYDRGTDDYFIIENRFPGSINSYDQSISDGGLIIWRIDEGVLTLPFSDSTRLIEIMLPNGSSPPVCGPGGGCYSGSPFDAWDPSDPLTPQRTMERTWRDGTPSRVAVRAIGPAGVVIRAYFDVRGPGVLVDPSTATGSPMNIEVVPEEVNLITFPVLNTGEEWDGFEFTLVGTPADWVVSTQHRDLEPGVPATASINVTVPADTAVAEYEVEAVGTSITDPSVSTQSPLMLTVTLHDTSIGYYGDTSAQWRKQARLRAQISDLDDPSETVTGAEVAFVISDGIDSISTSAITGSDGAAEVAPYLNLPPGDYELTITCLRVGKHGAAEIAVPFTVLSMMDVIEASAPTLEGILPTGDPEADKVILKAIDHIEKSLTPEWWMDELTLDVKNGKKVFDEERKAVKELTKKQTEGISEVQAVVDALVSAAEALAQKAIDDASTAGGDPKDLEKANEEMAKAADELAKGNPDKAIYHYRKAWETAQKSVKNL